MRYASVVLVCLMVGAFSASGQCPTITVTGPTGVTNSGDEMTFRVEVGAIGPNFRFAWSIDRGTISGGQGTARLIVQTDRELSGGTVTATVTVEGLSSGCPSSASESAPVMELPGCGMELDQWGRLKPNDQRGRLDSFFAELSNNPDNVGFVRLRITHGERLDGQNRRIQFILKHAKFRKFDKARIWFGLELGEEAETGLSRIPPGAERRCPDCLVLKGEVL